MDQHYVDSTVSSCAYVLHLIIFKLGHLYTFVYKS